MIESVHISEQLQDNADYARLRLDQAKALMALGKPDEAQAHLHFAMAVFERQGLHRLQREAAELFAENGRNRQ